MLRTATVTVTGTVSLYVYDGLGNPTAIVRDIGGTGYTYQYDPYGLPTLTSNSGGAGTSQNPFLFKGGIQDRATGWILFGNRWYNTTIGRWTQQDTLDAPIDPVNANRYAYAGADPINNSDPTGLWFDGGYNIARTAAVGLGTGLAAAGLACIGAALATAGPGCVAAGSAAFITTAVVGIVGDVISQAFE